MALVARFLHILSALVTIFVCFEKAFSSDLPERLYPSGQIGVSQSIKELFQIEPQINPPLLAPEQFVLRDSNENPIEGKIDIEIDPLQAALAVYNKLGNPQEKKNWFEIQIQILPLLIISKDSENQFPLQKLKEYRYKFHEIKDSLEIQNLKSLSIDFYLINALSQIQNEVPGTISFVREIFFDPQNNNNLNSAILNFLKQAKDFNTNIEDTPKWIERLLSWSPKQTDTKNIEEIIDTLVDLPTNGDGIVDCFVLILNQIKPGEELLFIKLVLVMDQFLLETTYINQMLTAVYNKLIELNSYSLNELDDIRTELLTKTIQLEIYTSKKSIHRADYNIRQLIANINSTGSN